MVSVQGSWLCFLGRSAVLVLSCLCLSLCQGHSQRCVAFAGAGPNLSQGPMLLWGHLAYIRSLPTGEGPSVLETPASSSLSAFEQVSVGVNPSLVLGQSLIPRPPVHGREWAPHRVDGREPMPVEPCLEYRPLRAPSFASRFSPLAKVEHPLQPPSTGALPFTARAHAFALLCVLRCRHLLAVGMGLVLCVLAMFHQAVLPVCPGLSFFRRDLPSLLRVSA